MNYRIARRVIGSNNHIPITKDRHVQLVIDKQLAILAYVLEVKFDILVENYLEFENTLLELTLKNAILYSGTWAEFQQHRAIVTRRLANLLSGCRMFLDHLDHELRRLDQNLPGVQDAYRIAKSNEYDSKLGYRAMEAMRNWGQHRSDPIFSITHDMAHVKVENELYTDCRTVPLINIEEIRSEGGFKSSVLQELESDPNLSNGLLDVRPFVRGYIKGLSNVHQNVCTFMKDRIDCAEQNILHAIKEFTDKFPEDKPSGIVTTEVNNEGRFGIYEYLFDKFIHERKRLSLKNSRLAHAQQLFISNATFDKTSLYSNTITDL